jgi:hypothetical protein
MMKVKTMWKYLPPPGPIMSLLLIGIVLLSALLYYRAVKIQRFLEPALALSQPRNEFTKNINLIVQKEFGAQPLRGLQVKSSSILMDTSLLFTREGTPRATAQSDIRKLARVLVTLMRDDHVRSEISLIMIIGQYATHGVTPATALNRLKTLEFVGIIQDALFQAEPQLSANFSRYFAVSAVPRDPHSPPGNVVEFRIVPSEYLHIEVLDKLEKYSN